jgi:immune inhibitor A
MSHAAIRRVPPAPQVIAQLYADYRRSGMADQISFGDYLRVIGFVDHSKEHVGADRGRRTAIGPEAALVAVPKHPVTGALRIIVLLVDFADNIAQRPLHEFEDMLFSDGAFLSGSMREYYREVSCGKVEVTGSVHGWLRMPQPYSYYVNNRSGMGSYPRNAQRLAEDALRVALAEHVDFPPELDKLGQRTITGLFIVHAGSGAEVLTSVPEQRKRIWSHKNDMHTAFPVRTGLAASNYLTVPEDCTMGVCAHELGHLAFQWDDFYDPNYDRDGNEWDGSGSWDLMAGGSWNSGGNVPAHPAGLHKSQHGWVELQMISETTQGVVLRPYDASTGTVVRIKGPTFSPTQSLILENRQRRGFDTSLPGNGLLVWRVDTRLEQIAPIEPAMLLIQADGRHQLETPGDFNAGDAGDPFPGSAQKSELGDTGSISTSFPGAPPSRIRLTSINEAPTGEISFDVSIN